MEGNIKYKIVKLEDDYYKSLKFLYYKVFKVRFPLTYIYKLYDTKLFGLSNIGYLALDDSNNEPSAFYGVYPIIISYDNKDYLVAQSGSTMTHPKHRFKGLFINLATETYSLAKRENVSFVFGFPNINSYSGFKNKLNWIFYGNMKIFSIIGASIPLCELFHKTKILKNLYINFIKYKLKKYILPITDNNISKFNFSSNKFQIKHDLNFFKYKNYSNSFLISFNKFILFIKVDNHLLVGDVGFFEKEDTVEFINTLKMIAGLIYSNKIIISINENHWLYNYLKYYLTPREGLPIGILNFSFKHSFDDISFTLCDFDTF